MQLALTFFFENWLYLFRRGDPQILYTGWQIQKSSTIEEDFLQGEEKGEMGTAWQGVVISETICLSPCSYYSASV